MTSRTLQWDCVLQQKRSSLSLGPTDKFFSMDGERAYCQSKSLQWLTMSWSEFSCIAASSCCFQDASFSLVGREKRQSDWNAWSRSSSFCNSLGDVICSCGWLSRSVQLESNGWLSHGNGVFVRTTPQGSWGLVGSVLNCVGEKVIDVAMVAEIRNITRIRWELLKELIKGSDKECS